MPNIWTYFVREDADEHHARVYFQVFLQNKIPLGILPSFHTRYSPLEYPLLLAHPQPSSVHFPTGSKRMMSQYLNKGNYIHHSSTHQPPGPGLYIGRAHPLYHSQSFFGEGLLVIIPFNLPHFCVGSNIVWIKRPGNRC